MFKKYLKEAYNNGFEVIIQFDYCCNSRFIGRIMDLDDEHFQLYHMSELNCMSWIFKIKDIRYIGVYNNAGMAFIYEDDISQNKEISDGN